MLFDIATEARGSYDETMFCIDVDENDFRRHARENDPPDEWARCEMLHPFCRDEWFKLGKLPEKPYLGGNI